MVLLGVNVDHVATVRQARRTYEPDPVTAASLAELAGADIITVHLRGDRRHAQDRDVEVLSRTVTTRLNLEMAVSEEMVGVALARRPGEATLVPENREEVTTEGGLDVAGQAGRVADAVGRLKEAGIVVSLFIDPEERQVRAAKEAGADAVELHTGSYANAEEAGAAAARLKELEAGAALARGLGLGLHAGHGLTYVNVGAVVSRLRPEELHIGHSIVARAVYVGISQAVREMKETIWRAEVLGETRPESGR